MAASLISSLIIAPIEAPWKIFFMTSCPQHLSHKPRLVQAAGHHFSDKAPKYVSLINLASLRELAQEWHEDLDPLRFRANIYIDDVKPFSELEWVGKTIQLGQVTAMVMLRNGRCSATNVNPNTGMRDRNIPGKLRQAFGHKDLGIYLSVTQGGWLHEGEKVVINPSIDSATQPSSSSSPIDTAELLICRACYYLFDPRLLDASWHTPQDLPESWRCKDCGANRDTLRSAKK
jgi:GntR family transcriptional regulator/MocR family aminotransferase